VTRHCRSSRTYITPPSRPVTSITAPRRRSPPSAATASSPARRVKSYSTAPHGASPVEVHAGILPEPTMPRPLRCWLPGGYFSSPESPSRTYKGPCAASHLASHRHSRIPLLSRASKHHHLNHHCRPPPDAEEPSTRAVPDQGEGRDR
jgi:hypothetical protein